MKLLITDNTSQTLSHDVIQVSSDADLLSMLKVFTPSSLDIIESGTSLSNKTNVCDKDLWKMLFALLKENGEISLKIESGTMGTEQRQQVISFMKINGFKNAQLNDNHVQGKKPQWQSAGAPLKRKQ